MKVKPRYKKKSSFRKPKPKLSQRNNNNIHSLIKVGMYLILNAIKKKKLQVYSEVYQ